VRVQVGKRAVSLEGKRLHVKQPSDYALNRLKAHAHSDDTSTNATGGGYSGSTPESPYNPSSVASTPSASLLRHLARSPYRRRPDRIYPISRHRPRMASDTNLGSPEPASTAKQPHSFAEHPTTRSASGSRWAIHGEDSTITANENGQHTPPSRTGILYSQQQQNTRCSPSQSQIQEASIRAPPF
jgi:hypothetical protein